MLGVLLSRERVKLLLLFSVEQRTNFRPGPQPRLFKTRPQFLAQRAIIVTRLVQNSAHVGGLLIREIQFLPHLLEPLFMLAAIAPVASRARARTIQASQ